MRRANISCPLPTTARAEPAFAFTGLTLLAAVPATLNITTGVECIPDASVIDAGSGDSAADLLLSLSGVECSAGVLAIGTGVRNSDVACVAERRFVNALHHRVAYLTALRTTTMLVFTSGF